MSYTVGDILPRNSREALPDQFLGVDMCLVDNSVSLYCLEVVLHFGEDHFYLIVFSRVGRIEYGNEV